MTEVEQPPQNGLSAAEDDDSSKARPADIEQDMREMERRKRVEAIMSSKLFREELERIVDSARDSGGASGILQQLSDIVGIPASRVGSVYKASNCMMPINDIRGVESMGYAKGEKILRCKLAATFRLLDLYGWTQGLGAQITARLKVDQEYFLVNPYGMLFHEITASSLNKVDMQGNIVEQGTTNFGVNKSHFTLHSVVHAARPDIRCAIYIGCSPVVAISSLKTGLLPITKDACVLGDLSTYAYTGAALDAEERNKLVRNLGPNSKVLLLSNYGALCCGETIEEAFFAACHIVQACETQLKLLPVGLDNLVLIPEESRKIIYEQSRRPPEDLEKKFAAINTDENAATTQENEAHVVKVGAAPKWRVGGAEFEALMRMLDNAGYRTGYIYRHPLIKSDPPKPKNDVELPPAVSSLGYLLEEEELFRQGIWKKGDLRKGGDRSRWLNSPNVYQKVEVLETGTPDPKKITKWVAEGSPTHSTPVRIEDPLQFVPAGTTTKEFKRLQQQIKDNRRADKISAGPQSHILEGVTWDEANRIKDATVSSAGDHVVLMGAASKGIIQRGYQHNAAVYKAPYAKNPFDNVTDDELNEYKRTVERKKKSIHGEYTDTDFSESEALSSLQTSGAQHTKQTTTATVGVTQSEPEDVLEHQVIRIQTQQAPVPSQPEVVLSDATLNFLNGERSHAALNRKPPTGRDTEKFMKFQNQSNQDTQQQNVRDVIILAYNNKNDRHIKLDQNANLSDKENIFAGDQNTIHCHLELIAELKSYLKMQRKKYKLMAATPAATTSPATTKKCSITVDGFSSDSSSSPAAVSNDNDKGNDSGSSNAAIGSQSPNKDTNNNLTPLNSSYPANKPPSSQMHTNTNLTLSTSELKHMTRLPSPPRRQLADYCYELQPYAMKSCDTTLYDTANSTDYLTDIDDNSTTTSQQDPENDNYKTSIFCCTPAICETVFESMQKPLDNDLIFNIPFSIVTPTSTASTTPRKARYDTTSRQGTPRKLSTKSSKSLSQDAGEKSLSPYRTVSHFGFKSPQREPQPAHKHIPCATEPKKYVPLRKSVSFEEIFSSPRFVDLCENCFEKVVRFKPEIINMRTRLRNISEFHGATNRLVGGAATLTCGEMRAVVVADNNIYDYADCASSETTETLPAFSSQLEPVLEVEEIEGEYFEASLLPKMNKTTGHAGKDVTTSSFIDKIMGLNYSEESANINYPQTPHTITSNISVASNITEESMDKLALEEASANRSMVEVSTDVDDLTQNEGMQQPKTIITEIWEFGNWPEREDTQSTGTREKSLSDAADSSISLHYSTAHENLLEVAAIESDINRNNSKTNNNTSASDSCHSLDSAERQQQTRRLLMSREERSRRKLEFQELWEDHIYFFNSKEQTNLSDTESAIDGSNIAQEIREPSRVNMFEEAEEHNKTKEQQENLFEQPQKEVQKTLESAEFDDFAKLNQEVQNQEEQFEERDKLEIPAKENKQLKRVALIEELKTQALFTKALAVEAPDTEEDLQSKVYVSKEANTQISTSKELGIQVSISAEEKEQMFTSKENKNQVCFLEKLPNTVEVPVDATKIQASDELEYQSNVSEAVEPSFSTEDEKCEKKLSTKNQNKKKIVFDMDVTTKNDREFQREVNTQAAEPQTLTDQTEQCKDEVTLHLIEETEECTDSDQKDSYVAENTTEVRNNKIKKQKSKTQKVPKPKLKLKKRHFMLHQSLWARGELGQSKKALQKLMPAQLMEDVSQDNTKLYLAESDIKIITKNQETKFFHEEEKEESEEDNCERYENYYKHYKPSKITKRKVLYEEEKKMLSEAEDDNFERCENYNERSEMRQRFLHNERKQMIQTEQESEEYCFGRYGNYNEPNEQPNILHRRILQELKTKQNAGVASVADQETYYAEDDVPSDEAEIFQSRSFIVARNKNPKNSQSVFKQLQLECGLNEEGQPSEECDSERTYNIQRETPRGHLFFRAPESGHAGGPGNHARIDYLDGKAIDMKIGDGNCCRYNRMPYEPSMQTFELYRQSPVENSDRFESYMSTHGAAASSETDLQFNDLVAANSDYLNANVNEDFNQLLGEAGNVETFNAAAYEELNPIERKILHRINLSKLKENGEIFDKIEKSIRNKLTPSKMQDLITQHQQQQQQSPQYQQQHEHYQQYQQQQQQQHPQQQHHYNSACPIHGLNKYRTAAVATAGEMGAYAVGVKESFEAEDAATFGQPQQHSEMRRSRSLTPELYAGHNIQWQQGGEVCNYCTRSTSLNDNLPTYACADAIAGTSHVCGGAAAGGGGYSSCDASDTRVFLHLHANHQRQTTHAMCIGAPQTTRSAPDFSRKTHAMSALRKRNFILENIRSVTTPRGISSGINHVHWKRLQGGATTNPPACSHSSTSPRNVYPSTISHKKQEQSSSRRDDDSLYSFQSKVVRDSPKFWLSMAKTPRANKPQKTAHAKQVATKVARKIVKKPNHTTQKPACSTDVAVAAAATTDTCTVDVELVDAQTLCTSTHHSTRSKRFKVTKTKVDLKIEELDEQIKELDPRLETYRRKLHDYGENVAKCSRNIDECIAVQREFVTQHEEMCDQILLNQYSERIGCQVQTYSISETED